MTAANEQLDVSHDLRSRLSSQYIGPGNRVRLVFGKTKLQSGKSSPSLHPKKVVTSKYNIESFVEIKIARLLGRI